MYRKGVFVGFLAGAFAVVALMIVLSIREDVPRAMAQEVSPAIRPVPDAPPAQRKTETLEIRVQEGQAPAVAAAAAAPRYQISAWGSNGALVIDTQTGVIWQYYNSGTPLRKVGKVPAE
jgi:hypothetical protein